MVFPEPTVEGGKSGSISESEVESQWQVTRKSKVDGKSLKSQS